METPDNIDTVVGRPIAEEPCEVVSAPETLSKDVTTNTTREHKDKSHHVDGIQSSSEPRIENSTQGQPRKHSAGTKPQEEPGSHVPTTDLLSNMQQYRRMEECLYRHRKEWEEQGGPGEWHMYETARRMKFEHNGPWDYSWNLNYVNSYDRPDPFNPAHSCDQNKNGTDSNEHDEYDDTIDYGDRRERLRKNFEWDMDRLFLAEETQRRRRAEQIIKKAGISSKEQSHNVIDSSGYQQPGTSGGNGPVTVNLSVPLLNRVDWPSFVQLAKIEEKKAFAIDVLIGEPSIDDVSDKRAWYIPARRGKLERPGERKATATALPGQLPLPERIRIHSSLLIKILSKVLESGQETPLSTAITPCVFLRPFKALYYCEQALRDWCDALEKKFAVSSPVVANESLTTNKTSAASHNGSLDGKSLRSETVVDIRAQMELLRSDLPLLEENGLEEDVKSTEGKDQNNLGDDKPKQPEEDNPNDITKSHVALEHLKCLLSFFDSDILTKRQYLNYSDYRRVLFHDLWQIFRPGIEVINQNGKQAYRVVEVSSTRHHVTADRKGWYGAKGVERNTFKIACIHIDFDGKNIGPVLSTFNISKYEGERDISSFEVYPLRFHPTKRVDFSDSEWAEVESLPPNERLRYKLIRRGEKFVDVASVRHMYYAGLAVGAQDEVESQVVVDAETAFSVENREKDERPELEDLTRYLSGNNFQGLGGESDPCTEKCCKLDNVHDDSYVDKRHRKDYLQSLLPDSRDGDRVLSVAIMPCLLSEVKKDNHLTAAITTNELVIMSYRVFGFVLRSRKWAQLDLSYLTDVHLAETLTSIGENQGVETGNKPKRRHLTAFDRLVLEQGHKPMIVSLIAQHFRDKESTAGDREQVDIVRGKGKGLILLLHGAPGVGKTSTAEGVAELFRKPLFQITCGDLGTTAREVEKTLEINFALANRWGCILLLDEADVFLAERTKEDFLRNGLVAVFLRVLEYYSGILFLTTNRVGDFDEAFTSRIHMSLYYSELNQVKTVEIFKINLELIEERFDKKGRHIEVDKLGIGSFASQHFAEHPQARWNGRQIRNACQTALALAEFEAQGNSHEAILNPKAAVMLKVTHFQTVRDAYLGFNKYMNDLYGSSAARRAKEARLRAIWIDQNDQVVGASGLSSTAADRKAAFALAAQGLAQIPALNQPQERQQQHQPPQFHNLQQSFSVQPNASQSSIQSQTHAGFPHQNSLPYIYNNTGSTTSQPIYTNPNSTLPHTGSFPTNIPGNNAPPAPPVGQGQAPLPSSHPTIPQHTHNRQPNPPWLNQNIQAMYAAATAQDARQTPRN